MPHPMNHDSFRYLLLAQVEDHVQIWIAVSAALAAPLTVTIGIAYWERWSGSALMLNVLKCSLASFLFVAVLVSQIAAGVSVMPPDSESACMLMLSGFLGIVVADMAWIQAIKLVGARTCVILGASKPLVAKIVGIIYLSQPASLLLVLGIALISIGLVFAHIGRSEAPMAISHDGLSPKVSPRSYETPPMEIAAACENAHITNLRDQSFCTLSSVDDKSRKFASGVVLQICNMVIDIAAAAITRAYGGNSGPWQINAIRFGSAAMLMLLFTVMVWVVAFARAVKRPSWASLPRQSAREWSFIIFGTLLVTFVTPALGNYALFRLHFGAWAALTALGPVYSIPIFWFVKGERTNMIGIFGAILAVAGTAIIPLAARAQ